MTYIKTMTSLVNVIEKGINHNILLTIKKSKTNDVRDFFLQYFKSVCTLPYYCITPK